MYSIIYFIENENGQVESKTGNFTSAERARMYIGYLLRKGVQKIDLYDPEGRTYTFTPAC